MPRKLPPLPPKAELKLGSGVLRDYTYTKLGKYDEREVRLEYRRLYRIYQHRMSRLEKSRFKGFAEEQRGRFKPISQITYRQVRNTLIDLARWVQNREYYSVSGQEDIRARRLETLHGLGDEYIHITDENFDEFGEFMRQYRDSKLDSLYDSDAAVDIFDILSALDMPTTLIQSDFEKYLKNRETVVGIYETRQYSSPNWEAATAEEISLFIERSPTHDNN